MTAAPIIYLDHAATTPVDPRAIAPMLECLGPGGDFANASSAHAPGRAARARVESARVAAARLIGAAPADVYFTSGATESDNLAILGVARAARGARHVVTTRIEWRLFSCSASPGARLSVQPLNTLGDAAPLALTWCTA